MKYKCWYCNKTDTEEKILHKHITKSGSPINKRYHKDCYPKFLVQQEFIDKERKELDDLYKKILEVHKIDTVPNQFYPFIQDLRNGTVIFGKNKRKKYKEGFPYPLIAKTYDFCREDIEYWKSNIEFDSTMSELKYGWAIINDKVNVVKKREEKREFLIAKKQAEEQEEKKNETFSHPNKSVEFKKQKRDDDISDFL